ncbi:GGDEF domain-containing protein [Catenovulum sp. SM1970]|uniref:GGDEF domain-containing protein n=1 Tax=Marinifaba aquimaris TaxID=2741323 RepID=UPI00157446C6|nr:GGDEF domain-containing protein [Marinifaba aquimaris]NTS76229.1 GGDEF domain-containing protein [Marinifaba aquimaris]
MATPNHIKKIESIFVVCLFMLTIFLCFLQFLGFERVLVLDLTDTERFSVRDDRPFGGASVSNFEVTDQGILFSCQVKQQYQWPYCEFIIDLTSQQNGQLAGIDFTRFSKVGLWLKHDHPNQPGTRFEMHNFNDAYSKPEQINSLKYNTVEFSENNVPYPTWINFHSFYVPVWWNSLHDLSLQHGGTDFSNVHSIAVTTGGLIPDGPYKITIEKIEFRGQYIQNETLFFALIVLWSTVAGFFFKRLIEIKDHLNQVSQEKKHWQMRATYDGLTDAYSKQSAPNLFMQLQATNLESSLLFLDIDHFKQINDNYGHDVGDDVLIQFSHIIQRFISDDMKLIRWGGEEFLLLCPGLSLERAHQLAEELRTLVHQTQWPDVLEVTVSIGVALYANDDINRTISLADRALYRAKHQGRNQVCVAT